MFESDQKMLHISNILISQNKFRIFFLQLFSHLLHKMLIHLNFKHFHFLSHESDCSHWSIIWKVKECKNVLKTSLLLQFYCTVDLLKNIYSHYIFKWQRKFLQTIFKSANLMSLKQLFTVISSWFSATMFFLISLWHSLIKEVCHFFWKNFTRYFRIFMRLLHSQHLMNCYTSTVK